MIGDGLGPAQIALARRFQGPAGTRLQLESLPVVGLVSNWSTSNAVTDSGAAATAMASGVKTSNARIGMDVDGWPRQRLSASR
jgi:alkaline phosphatase